MQAPQAQKDLREVARRATSAFSTTDIKAVLKDPVIIVSAPRSGSNLLFEQLARFPGFWTIGGESHAILRAFPQLRAENPEFDSGSLGEEHADPETRRLLRSCFLYLLRDHRGEPYLDRPDSRRPSTVCLLEKTPRNALNIPFLLKVFPRARFVFLHRDPRQTIASLIEAWTLGLQTGRFVTFPSLPGWDRPAWCFLLPQGWRKMRGRSLAEIAAFQWSASNTVIMEGLAPLPAERWTTLTYRAFIADPGKSLTGLSRFAGIEAADVQLNGGALPLSRTTLTPPHPDKWKKYEHELEALWPDLSETAGKIERFCEGHGDPR